MNWVDLSLLGIVALSAVLAFMRGFVREVLGIGAWAGAVVFAVWAFPMVRGRFRVWIPNPDFADPIAYAAMFLLALVILSVVIGLISGIIRTSVLGGIDRTLGMVFGLVRGAALIAFAYIAMGWIVATDRWPAPVQQARLLPYAYRGAAWAAEFLPSEYRPNVPPPPAGREARAVDLLHANPQGRALDRP